MNNIQGDHTIPEGMSVLVYQGRIMRREEYWTKPGQFIPERFLDSDGKFLSVTSQSIHPFRCRTTRLFGRTVGNR